MKSNNIVLIGFMGSGKSTIATLLSQRCKRFVLDSDSVIEHSVGYSVKEYFAHFGEHAYRHKEQEFITWARGITGAIIATGGGMPIFNDIGDMGKIVLLQASFTHILARLNEAELAKRPLFADITQARALFTARQKIYEKQADIIINANGNKHDVATHIINALQL